MVQNHKLTKMYHMYKINKLKNDNSAKKLAPAQLKKTSSKINEIDFTYSFLPSDSQNTEQQSLPLASSTSNNHKCPVIECDFNFMGDEAQSQTPSPKRNVTNSTLFQRLKLKMIQRNYNVPFSNLIYIINQRVYNRNCNLYGNQF